MTEKQRAMKNAPTLYTLEALLKDTVNPSVAANIDGKWVPARPCGLYSIGNRVRCAWAVFTGRADAVQWPGQ